jgi:integrase
MDNPTKSDHAKITLTTIKSLQPGRILWDTEVSAFCARRQKGEARTYCVLYRTKAGRQRWHTIGRHGSPWTPDTARARARSVLAEVENGSDPAGEKQADRAAPTVAQLCHDYLTAASAGRILTRRRMAKKASTLAVDTSNIYNHIKPLLGNLKVIAVTRRDIEQFRDDVTDGKTAAATSSPRGGGRVTGGRGSTTRILGLLGAIFAFSVKRGLRPDNPCRGVERHADGQRTRRVTEAEYAALGRALRGMPANVWPVAVAAAHFLAISGWRRGEMLALKWSEVDLATRTARLADTKTGSSLRPMSRAACEILRNLPRMGELVFPASRGADQPMAAFHKSWLAIARKAKLPANVTPHILRHSLASVAADLGYSELTIAALLGHKKASVTSKYAHHADAVLLQAADAVSDRIAELMGDGKAPGVVVELQKSAL